MLTYLFRFVKYWYTLIQDFRLNLNPSPDRIVESSFSDLSKKMDNALSHTLDIFTKLPSFKAYCPTAYFIQLIFFWFFFIANQVWWDFANLCIFVIVQSELFKNNQLFFHFIIGYWTIKRVFKIPNSVKIFKQIRQNKEVDLPPPYS